MTRLFQRTDRDCFKRRGVQPYESSALPPIGLTLGKKIQKPTTKTTIKCNFGIHFPSGGYEIRTFDAFTSTAGHIGTLPYRLARPRDKFTQSPLERGRGFPPPSTARTVSSRLRARPGLELSVSGRTRFRT